MHEIRRYTLLLASTVSAALLATTPLLAQQPYTTSWIGNTFDGAGENGSGRWVQNFVNDIKVTPDGTVIAHAQWDEAGRCLGLYKDGTVNNSLLKQYDGNGGHASWGWGTGGRAVSADASYIYACNDSEELMRFAWDPANINFWDYIGQTSIGAGSDAVGMDVNSGKIYLIRQNGDVQVRNTSDLSLIRTFNVGDGARDITVDGANTLWVIVGTQIKHYSDTGTQLSGTITDVVKPMSLSLDNQGRLVVCEDGPRQQVLFYSVSGTPSLVQTFGANGGLRSGTPGEIQPTKLFSLRGASTDSQGNIYVAISDRETILRKFTSSGTLVWEVQSHAFLDSFDPNPVNDALEIYGCDEIFEMDYSKPPGQEWRLKAITRDPIAYPNDPRLSYGTCSAIIRTLSGRRILYTHGQYDSGYDIFSFENAPSQIARPAGAVKRDKGWAWDVDDNGDIWQGETPGKTIRRYPFGGLDTNGYPRYDESTPVETPVPAPFNRIQRIKYIAATDTMYLAGYTPEKGEVSWGLIGSVIARYDGWKAGNRTAAYVFDTPTDDEQLHPKSLDVAGDYIFVAFVKSKSGKQGMVHVHSAASGAKVTELFPGPEVGGNSGWVDIPYGIRVHERSNGEFLVVVEEDHRAKNIMYRWTPQAPATGLTAEYFDNRDFTGTKASRRESAVNFDWGSGSPTAAIGADTFSARWNGFVQPAHTQAYTFYTMSDDGVRLWVNGQLLIDNWTDHGPTENSKTISLTAGQRYAIRMEYYEQGGGAVAKLSWSSASQSKQIIPQNRLFPSRIVSGGVYRITPKLALSKALDVSGVSTSNGAQVHIWDWLNGANQRWSLTDVGNGLHKLTPQHAASKALDVNASLTGDGTKIQIWDANGSKAQRWTITDTGGGFYKLQPECAPGSCLDVNGSGTANGTVTQLWSDNGSDAQRWKVDQQ